MKPKAAVWVFFLLFGIAARIFPQQFIMTDAAEGVFSADQRLTFAITGPGWLRLLIDDREIYRGRGPAYPEMGLNQGEERVFNLSAEYYSPENDLLESRSWSVCIDKKPPVLPFMEFRNTHEGLRLIQSGEKQNAMIRALADIEGSLVFFADLGEADTPPADYFSALIWAEDLAGNCSEPGLEYFEISLVKIENPIPGEWLNPQTLIISGAEGLNVYWTVDGSNPLEPGGTGRRYLGPERIEKRGLLTLRIAWRDSAGRVREDRTVYTVADNGGRVPDLDLFYKSEEKVISSLTNLPLPGAYLWSMGGIPRRHDAESISLRPEPLIKRAAALHLLPEGKPPSGGLYRFAYFLDGDVSGGQRKNQLPSQAKVPIGETILRPSALRLISAGRIRLLIWPQVQGSIYYSWGSVRPNVSDAGAAGVLGSWHEGRAHLPVPLEGGTLSWFVLDRESMEAGRSESAFAGPYSVHIAPLPGIREAIRGRIALRNYDENKNQRWEFVSALLDYRPGMLKSSTPGIFDVCDGEDIEWAFISSGGTILEQQRRDRLSPPAPGLSAPPEEGWTRGPVKLGVIPDEMGAIGFISAKLRYASGTDEVFSGAGSLDIASSRGEPAEVTVEAMLVDASGNRGPKTVRHFTLDPKTIYVSDAVKQTGVSAPGGMDNPFVSLEEALDYALENKLSDIRVAGTHELRKSVTVSGNMRINGDWRRQGAGNGKSQEAAVVLGDEFSWNINPGVSLNLSGLSLERRNGNNPLIHAGKDAKVEISDAAITNSGPLLSMDNGVCSIRDSRLLVSIPGDRRIAAFSASGSALEINGSRMQLEGNYGLLFDLREGSFSAGDSAFLAAGRKTATLLALNGSRGNFSNIAFEASARDYASVLEASNSELVISGGTLRVSARDVSALLLDHSPAVILDSLFQVGGSFSVRAAEIHGVFPVVRNSGFYSVGTAARYEVFASADAAVPKALSVTGNLFSGFTHIWGGAWPVDLLAGFNQAYASPDKPNRHEKTP